MRERIGDFLCDSLANVHDLCWGSSKKFVIFNDCCKKRIK